jgi:hypothetical protein
VLGAAALPALGAVVPVRHARGRRSPSNQRNKATAAATTHVAISRATCGTSGVSIPGPAENAAPTTGRPTRWSRREFRQVQRIHRNEPAHTHRVLQQLTCRPRHGKQRPDGPGVTTTSVLRPPAVVHPCRVQPSNVARTADLFNAPEHHP